MNLNENSQNRILLAVGSMTKQWKTTIENCVSNDTENEFQALLRQLAEGKLESGNPSPSL